MEKTKTARQFDLGVQLAKEPWAIWRKFENSFLVCLAAPSAILLGTLTVARRI